MFKTILLLSSNLLVLSLETSRRDFVGKCWRSFCLPVILIIFFRHNIQSKLVEGVSHGLTDFDPTSVRYTRCTLGFMLCCRHKRFMNRAEADMRGLDIKLRHIWTANMFLTKGNKILDDYY